MMIAVVVTPWNLLHHHESHVHDAHFFDDSNGLLSDHVFDECDFCEFVMPHYYNCTNEANLLAVCIEFPLLQVNERKAISTFTTIYLLRGPPILV